MADIKPWSLDILTRVIKVVRGGGIFVSPAFRGEGFEGAIIVLLDKATTSGPGWQEAVTITDDYPVVTPMCGAYGLAGGDPANDIPPKPTYVIGGSVYQPAQPDSDLLDLILTSHDGITWTKSRRGPSSFVYVMGWDVNKKKFYAQAVAFKSSTIEVLESADGMAWDVAATHILDPENQMWAAPLLQATGIPEITDDAGNIVPNGGIFGWDQGGNIWIAPRPVGTYRWYGEDGDDAKLSNIVDIIKKEIDPDTGAIITTKTSCSLPMAVVEYVAGTRGIWQAAGYNLSDGGDSISIMAKSTDNGLTWSVVYSTDLPTYAMIAGAKSS